MISYLLAAIVSGLVAAGIWMIAGGSLLAALGVYVLTGHLVIAAMVARTFVGRALFNR